MPSAALERELNDRRWERVAPLLLLRPRHPKGGRPFADDRACFEGVVYVLRNGRRWRAMPPGDPSGVTCWRRLRDGTAVGLWEDAWTLILRELAAAGRLRADELVLDGTFAEAKRGRRGRHGPARPRYHGRDRHRPPRHPARGGDGRGRRPRGEPGPGRPGRPGRRAA